MERTLPPASSQKSLAVLTKVVVGTIVIGFLYLGKPIFLPMALGLFLTLLLTPLVTALQRRRLPRALAVVLVILLVAVMLVGVVSLISLQLTSLIDDLPSHTENIKSKVRSIRGLGDGALIDRLGQMWDEVSAEWTRSPIVANRADPMLSGQSARETQDMEQSGGSSWAARVPDVLGSMFSGVVAFGLALVLAFFTLLRREAQRNRVIRLVGGSLVVATKAVDDAGERIGRYLRMQLVVNSSYGTIWGLGLFFVGLDYAVLWGFMAALLRFVPYVGPWISALMPLTLALAQFPGWWELTIILGLLITLELLSNNVLEPMLYGRSTGVSSVAMLLSAAFWAFLWGPAGLILSGPITVCLAVVGKHFSQVAIFDLLLGDDPVLEPHVSFYQRLVARDQDEATQIVLSQAKTEPLDHVFDEMVIPALNLIKQDLARADVTDADEQYVVETIHEVLIDLVAADPLGPAKPGSRNAEAEHHAPVASVSNPRVVVMGFPARDAEDQLALEMLRSLMSDRDWDFDIAPGGALLGEWVDDVAERSPAIVCIASLPPGGLAHTRYVCKRLRNRFPELRITIGRWGLREGIDADQEHLENIGADQVATTLRETRDQLNSWLPVFAEQQARENAGDDSGVRLAEVHSSFTTTPGGAQA